MCHGKRNRLKVQRGNELRLLLVHHGHLITKCIIYGSTTLQGIKKHMSQGVQGSAPSLSWALLSQELALILPATCRDRPAVILNDQRV